MSVDAKHNAVKDMVCLLPQSYDPSVKEVQMGLDELGVSLMRYQFIILLLENYQAMLWSFQVSQTFFQCNLFFRQSAYPHNTKTPSDSLSFCPFTFTYFHISRCSVA